MESPLSVFSSLQIDTKAFIWIKVLVELTLFPFVTKYHNLLNLHQNFSLPRFIINDLQLRLINE